MHEVTSISLGDFDVALEDIRIAETQLHCGDGHGLRDRTEVENTLLSHTGQVEQTFLGMLQRVQNHLRTAVKGCVEVLGLEEILEVVDMVGPNFLRPEPSVIIEILPDVTDDIGLLEEKAH